jgi:hypothetical protein
MAATDAKIYPIKNQAYRATLVILDADGDPVSGATGLDSEVSKDGGTFADCTSEATEIATASGIYFLDLTATEMNADTVAVQVKTTSSGAKTTVLVFYPLEDADIRVNAVQWAGSATATTNVALKTTLAKTTDITGFNDISTANVQTELTTYGALKPTTAGRTLDVTTGGEAGVDWANIGAPTTTVALSGTTIGTVTTLTNDPAGVTTLLGRITSTLFTGITSMKEWLGLLAGKQVGNTTARTEIRSSGAGSGTYDETVDSQEAIRDRGDVAWITGAGGDPWTTALPGAYGAGTAGNILGNRLDAAITTRLAPTTAGRTLDIATTGEAGLDFNNVAGTIPDSAGVTTLLTRITSTIFSGITSMKEWLGMLAGKQVGNTTARTEIRSSGAGAGTFDETTDSQEAIRDRGDTSWITGAGGDPWAIAIPGAYGAGTAGNILGNRLDAAVTTRLAPTTAGRTLDVNATGEAGIDLDNTVGTLAKGTELTGFNDLSAANVQTELSNYGAIKPTVAGRTLDISVGGEAGLDWANVGSPTTAQNLSGTTISTSQAVGSVSGSVGSVTGAVGSVTGAVGSVISPVTLTAAYDAAKTAATQASVNTIDDFLDTEVAAIKSQTDQLVFVGGKVEANAITTPADMNAIADALLKRDWNSVSGEAAYSALNAFRMLRNVWATAGGTLIVRKEDGSTTAWSRPLTVDPTAQPIVGAS